MRLRYIKYVLFLSAVIVLTILLTTAFALYVVVLAPSIQTVTQPKIQQFQLHTHNEQIARYLQLQFPIEGKHKGHRALLFDTGSPLLAVNGLNVHRNNTPLEWLHFQYGSGYIAGNVYYLTLNLPSINNDVPVNIKNMPVVSATIYKNMSFASGGIFGADMRSKPMRHLLKVCSPNDPSFTVEWASNVLSLGRSPRILSTPTPNEIVFSCFPLDSSERIYPRTSLNGKLLTRTEWWQFPITRMEVFDNRTNTVLHAFTTFQAIADTGTGNLVLPEVALTPIIKNNLGSIDAKTVETLLPQLPIYRFYNHLDQYIEVHPNNYLQKYSSSYKLAVSSANELKVNNFIILGVPSFRQHSVHFDYTREMVTYSKI